MRRLVLTTFILCMIFSPAALSARDITEETPAWILMEFGKEAYEAKEFGEALFYFRLAREQQSGDADAEYWIGRVFDAESDYQLAQRQYDRALDQQNLLYVAQDELLIKYSKADLNRKFGTPEQYLNSLIAILDGSQVTVGSGGRMAAIHDKLLEEGFDKTAQLYRFPDGGFAQAHIEAGIYLYRAGDYRTAADHLLAGGIMVISEVVAYLREKDPDYEYIDIPSFYTAAKRWENSRSYISAKNFIGILYYLGASLHASDEGDAAMSIWDSAAEIAVDTPWFDRIIRQMNNPWIDPL